MKSLGNAPRLGLVNGVWHAWKIPKSCSQMPVITDIQKMGYDSGLSLFHLGTEMVFNSGTGLWIQAGSFKCVLVMYMCWEFNRKKEWVQFLEWQGPYPEGSIQSITVLNWDCWKSCSFTETSEASFLKNLGLGIDWFTLLLGNGERGGDDSVTVKERKWWEGEGEVMSDDTFDDAPYYIGVGYSLFLLWLLPKKVVAHFPHNKACAVSYLITSKAYFT